MIDSILDTCLLKLYTKYQPEKLLHLVKYKNSCNIQDCKLVLEENGRFFVLSLLYKRDKLSKEALEIWRRISCGEIIDKDFPGLGFVIDYLISLNDAQLVWKYADHIMRRDPINGMKIFTGRNDQLFDFQQTLAYISLFGTRSRKIFLETYKKEKEKIKSIHKELALIYFQDILEFYDKELLDHTRMLHVKSFDELTFHQFLVTQKDPFSIARLKFYDFVVDECAADMTQLVGSLKEHRELECLYFEQLALAIKE